MSKKVMIVDDSRLVQRTMEQYLAGTEFEVAGCCRNGESALELYLQCRPDVVTMDIVMPGIDGFSTARAILEKDPNARILMASSLAYEDTIDMAVKVGAKGFVFKPLEKDQLLSALRAAFK